MNELTTEVGRRDLSPTTETPSGLAEQARAAAEIQAALTVAQARPRNEVRAIEKIMTACQRPRLAEDSQYDFSRGGTAITGANVKLLEVIAGYWGNLQYGFRELEQKDGQSSVEAFAWDLESNTKATRVFAVPHKMKARGSFKQLTDPTDIYYWVANQAQRRVRAALEEVIPRDVVEEALEECTKTMKEKAEITPEGLKKLVEAFKAYDVTRAHIEKRIQRHLEAMTPAQYVKLRRVFVSLKEGMSEPGDWFDLTTEKVEEHLKPTGKKDPDESEAEQKPPEQEAPPKSKDGTLPGMGDTPDDHLAQLLEDTLGEINRKRNRDFVSLCVDAFTEETVKLGDAVNSESIEEAVATVKLAAEKKIEELG